MCVQIHISSKVPRLLLHIARIEGSNLDVSSGTKNLVDTSVRTRTKK